MEPNDRAGEKEQLDVTDGATMSRAASVTKKAVIDLHKRLSCEGPQNPAWPFQSSQSNYDVAKTEYQGSPVEKYVATALGDEIPAMRDDLIERKKNGEGFVERHVNAWKNPENWKVDPENDLKEKSDPVQCSK